MKALIRFLRSQSFKWVSTVLFLLFFQGERHLTFEEPTISQWLYLQLKDKVDQLLVCNPTYVAEKSGAKTDFFTRLASKN